MNQSLSLSSKVREHECSIQYILCGYNLKLEHNSHLTWFLATRLNIQASRTFTRMYVSIVYSCIRSCADVPRSRGNDEKLRKHESEKPKDIKKTIRS